MNEIKLKLQACNRRQSEKVAAAAYAGNVKVEDFFEVQRQAGYHCEETPHCAEVRNADRPRRN